ncbi:MAG: hypothetical protein ACREQM_04055 [Candidatus Dormibacteraceae bacterium]
MPDRLLAALRRARLPEEVDAILAALDSDQHGIREALLDAYRRLAADPRRDPGAGVRAALLRGLADRATSDDVPLLVEAVDTYLRVPPNWEEVAARLRAAALACLAQADPPLAAYHAAALLDDAEALTGDPAVTAARVLGNLEILPPLYAHANAGEGGQVVAECLRQLAGAPWLIVARLLDRFSLSDDEVVELGLIDMLLEHQDRARSTTPLLRLLCRARSDVFRYGAAALVARREVGLLDALSAHPDLGAASAAALRDARTLLP